MDFHGWIFTGDIYTEIHTYKYSWECVEGTYMYAPNSHNNAYIWRIKAINEEDIPCWNNVSIDKVPIKYRAMMLLLI